MMLLQIFSQRRLLEAFLFNEKTFGRDAKKASSYKHFAGAQSNEPISGPDYPWMHCIIGPAVSIYLWTRLIGASFLGDILGCEKSWRLAFRCFKQRALEMPPLKSGVAAKPQQMIAAARDCRFRL
jgi:hypothetical protein